MILSSPPPSVKFVSSFFFYIPNTVSHPCILRKSCNTSPFPQINCPFISSSELRWEVGVPECINWRRGLSCSICLSLLLQSWCNIISSPELLLLWISHHEGLWPRTMSLIKPFLLQVVLVRIFYLATENKAEANPLMSFSNVFLIYVAVVQRCWNKNGIMKKKTLNPGWVLVLLRHMFFHCQDFVSVSWLGGIRTASFCPLDFLLYLRL